MTNTNQDQSKRQQEMQEEFGKVVAQFDTDNGSFKPGPGMTQPELAIAGYFWQAALASTPRVVMPSEDDATDIIQRVRWEADSKHYAIRSMAPEKLSEENQKIYKLSCNRYVALEIYRSLLKHMDNTNEL